MAGKPYGDKGGISQALSGDLFDKGVESVINVRENMKTKTHSFQDRAILGRRFIIEIINGQLPGQDISDTVLSRGLY